MLVLHYTGMTSAEAALARLRDPEARVSAHYLIREDGGTVILVPEAERAWHAGVSCWQGRVDLNDVSIGIELVNPGHEWGYRLFPEPQMMAVIALCREIVRRWGVPPARIVAHSDIAPARKEDPGELFDWPRLARAGLGLWPDSSVPEAPAPAMAAMRLAAIGYSVADPAVPFALVLAAFQRRYRRERVDGVLDPETMGLLREVARLCSPGTAVK
jgi:N-acetylmuramoyl-L-alanine amidase